MHLRRPRPALVLGVCLLLPLLLLPLPEARALEPAEPSTDAIVAPDLVLTLASHGLEGALEPAGRQRRYTLALALLAGVDLAGGVPLTAHSDAAESAGRATIGVRSVWPGGNVTFACTVPGANGSSASCALAFDSPAAGVLVFGSAQGDDARVDARNASTASVLLSREIATQTCLFSVTGALITRADGAWPGVGLAFGETRELRIDAVLQSASAADTARELGALGGLYAGAAGAYLAYLLGVAALARWRAARAATPRWASL